MEIGRAEVGTKIIAGQGKTRAGQRETRAGQGETRAGQRETRTGQKLGQGRAGQGKDQQNSELTCTMILACKMLEYIQASSRMILICRML